MGRGLWRYTRLVRLSGKAMLERDIGKRRPGYDECIARTSGFVPLSPRKLRGS